MLIVLVGPKGSGKSHVGRVLERTFGVRFVHVEPLWMRYYAECERADRAPDVPEGIARVHPRISEALATSENVCVETTGASAEILDALLSLTPAPERIVVRVTAPLELCLRRIAARDPTHHVPVPHELIEKIHAMSLSGAIEADFTLENDGLPAAAIAERFRPFLSR
jgi:shikimate kinase